MGNIFSPKKPKIDEGAKRVQDLQDKRIRRKESKEEREKQSRLAARQAAQGRRGPITLARTGSPGVKSNLGSAQK